MLTADVSLRMLADAQPPEGYDLLHQSQQALVAAQREILMGGKMRNEEILNFIEKAVTEEEHNSFLDKLEVFFVVGLWQALLYWLFAFWAFVIVIAGIATLITWVHKRRKGEKLVLPEFVSLFKKQT